MKERPMDHNRAKSTERPLPFSDGGFAIGLRPLRADPAWLEIDRRRAAQRALKRRLYAADPAAVFAAEPGTAAAQTEAAAAVAAALQAAGLAVDPATEAPPLLWAALQVQEDLALMMQDAPGAPWRLVAGSISFPSAWSLREKFGRPLTAVHGPVPGFNEGSRNARVIERVLGALRPEAPLERFGWSIYPDGTLAWPPSASPRLRAPMERPHLRTERQTLRKLPESGAVLFTIRLHIQSLEDYAAPPLGPERAAALADALVRMDDGAVAYKGLEQARPGLIARLRALAAMG